MPRWRFLVYVAFWLSLPAPAVGDGKVFPAIDHKALIPDQQAIIHFKDGRQTLVIETRFEGTGTEFAWIVPVPANPQIRAASTGVMPTVRAMMRPELERMRGAKLLFGILAVSTLVTILMLVTQGSVGARVTLGLLMWAVVVGAVLFPGLGRPRGPGGEGVVVLDRRIVGSYETATLSARTPDELLSWLKENGYRADAESAPAIADYIGRGWVFVVSRLRLDSASGEPLTPHPLAMTFDSPRAVYPVRLTGTGSRELKLELFVVGERMAAARGMRVAACHSLVRVAPFDGTVYLPSSPEGAYHGPVERLSLGAAVGTERLFNHPELVELFGDAKVITKLSGTFTPRQMRSDITLDWSAPRSKTERMYAGGGVAAWAGNVGIGVFWGGVLLARLRRRIRGHGVPKLRRDRALACAVAIAVGVLAYLPWTRAPLGSARAEWYRHYQTQQLASYLSIPAELASAGPERIVEHLRAQIADIYSEPDEHSPREGTAPGEYTLAVVEGRVEVRYFNAEGQVYVVSVGREREDP
jgi:hypothetical protein